MTTKERAHQLLDEYWLMDKISPPLSKEQAKQCSLIAVEEMISQMLSLMVLFNEDRSEFEAIELGYLTKLKQEIKKV